MNLRGPGAVQVVVGHVIDVVVSLELPRAVHDLSLDQRRVDHGDEPGLDRLRDRHIEQGQLESRADTFEEVEPRSAHLGAALHVKGVQTLGELEVVLRLEALRREVPCSTNGFKDCVVVLATARDALDDDVANAADQRRQLSLSRIRGGLKLLDPVGGDLGRG